MKTQGLYEGMVYGSFTADIYELKATNSCIEMESQRIRAQLNDCTRESHKLRAEFNELRHYMPILES